MLQIFRKAQLSIVKRCKHLGGGNAKFPFEKKIRLICVNKSSVLVQEGFPEEGKAHLGIP